MLVSFNRITKKFHIMRKLSHLVGCGLDFHYRMARNQFRLMMLVSGVPRVLFGNTIRSICGSRSTRFFDRIFDLLPQNLQGGRRMIHSSLTEGNDDSEIKKLYDFLKNIRPNILTHLSKSSGCFKVLNKFEAKMMIST